MQTVPVVLHCFLHSLLLEVRSRLQIQLVLLLGSISIQANLVQFGADTGDLALKLVANNVDLVVSCINIGLHEHAGAADLNVRSIPGLSHVTLVALGVPLVLHRLLPQLFDCLLKFGVVLLSLLEMDPESHTFTLLGFQALKLPLQTLPCATLSFDACAENLVLCRRRLFMLLELSTLRRDLLRSGNHVLLKLLKLGTHRFSYTSSLLGLEAGLSNSLA